MSRKPFISVSLGSKSQSTSNSNPQTTVAKKRNIFVEEDEEEVTGPPKRKLIKLTDDQTLDQAKQETKAEPEELDPLEAFMSNIKEPEIKQPKARRNDIEDEDDFDTFIKHRTEEIRTADPAQLQEFLQDYDSGDDNYLDKIRADNLVKILNC